MNNLAHSFDLWDSTEEDNPKKYKVKTLYVTVHEDQFTISVGQLFNDRALQVGDEIDLISSLPLSHPLSFYDTFEYIVRYWSMKKVRRVVMDGRGTPLIYEIPQKKIIPRSIV